ncbi:small multi-drug export protein [Nesterenkonia muleiensis]|uniref:small multi-drug export protein n=1 Tax=Nesterenkonia muleiensis TaxID=2282648 RepID=UPI001EE4A8DE|nr:small multi-drug export protein [Nesterenkonia muleiensis]
MIDTLPAFTEILSITAEADPTELVFPEDSFWGQLRSWTDSLPETLQWLGIIAISAIPFVESFFGGFIGVVVGMPFFAALAAAVVGNMLSLALVVYGAHWIRSGALKRQRPKELSESQQKRRAKTQRLLDRFGVPGVSLLGPLALPSQITAPLLVSFGANRHLVMLWMFVSVVIWGAGFTLLGVGFLNLLAA